MHLFTNLLLNPDFNLLPSRAGVERRIVQPMGLQDPSYSSILTARNIMDARSVMTSANR